MRVLAYVYPGWHPVPERDEAFYPGFTEWDLLERARPRFVGHRQPRVPLWGRYDDRDPAAVGRRIDLCREHGIDGWVYGHFWCRGKQVFQEALDFGFLGSVQGQRYPFALMWANRMPRRVLPVRRSDVPVIDASRLVSSDVEDFACFVHTVAEKYFTRDNYLRIDGRSYLSIFDSTFFVRELGQEGVRQAIGRARERLRSANLPSLHLAAIDPQPDVCTNLRELGFDSVTHYVLLPDWKGDYLQDYAERATASRRTWPSYAASSGLPYHPSLSPGWDATPRGADFGAERPNKYPWSPIVINTSPSLFQRAVESGIDYVRGAVPSTEQRLLFLASLNEWTEGHYLEADVEDGFGWLEAVRRAREARRECSETET